MSKLSVEEKAESLSVCQKLDRLLRKFESKGLLSQEEREEFTRDIGTLYSLDKEKSENYARTYIKLERK